MITDAEFWSIIMLVFSMLFLTALSVELESGLFLILAGLSGLILVFITFPITASVLVSIILIALALLLLLRGMTDMLNIGVPADG